MSAYNRRGNLVARVFHKMLTWRTGQSEWRDHVGREWPFAWRYQSLCRVSSAVSSCSINFRSLLWFPLYSQCIVYRLQLDSVRYKVRVSKLGIDIGSKKRCSEQRVELLAVRWSDTVELLLYHYAEHESIGICSVTSCSVECCLATRANYLTSYYFVSWLKKLVFRIFTIVWWWWLTAWFIVHGSLTTGFNIDLK